MADDEDFSDNEKWEAYRQSAAFRRASFHPPDEIWTIFSEAEDCCDIIDYMKALVKALNIDPNLHGIQFYEVLKSKLTSWKCQSLWDLLNARLKNKEYKNGTAAKDVKCLIIGAGPIGLRTAIELLLLGCKVSIVEKRTEFTRNNVLHLWPFLLTDFRSLGAKKFYGKFGAGCIDHINIRTLQCILLKVVLILGGEVHTGVSFKHMMEPKNEDSGWTAAFEPENLILSKSAFDVVIGADGKKNVLPGFPQIELRGALAIGITCNFVNNNTIEEARVPEISGVSYQFNPNFFKDMDAKYGVKLENIVYYKNETHYFVMTALKSSLLQLGVLKKDSSDPKDLLSKSNIDKTKLVDFTLSAVNFATDHQLPPLEFKKLSNGDSDIALFDFTSIKKAANASRIIERKKHKLAMALVGDSLIEPFWPTGSGCGRGVLSALDVAWMVRQFALKHPPLSVLRERENIFKLLGSSSNDSLQKNYAAYTIDPRTRYSGFDTKRVSNMTSLKGLYDTDDLESADMTLTSPSSSPLTTSAKKVASRKRSTSGGARKVSTHLHPGSAAKHKRKSDRGTVVKEQPDMVNTKQFWEEHNKKNFAAKATEYVPKTKVSHTSLGEPDLSIEELSELEDDVIESEPTAKKGFNTSQKIAIKRQASRDEHKSTSARSHSTSDEASGTTKRKYQAKGGGLKTKRTESSSKGKSPEKTEENKSSRRRFSTRKRQSSHKKATPEKEKKEIKEEYVSTKEPPRIRETPQNFLRKWMATVTNMLSPTVEQATPNESVDYCTRYAAATVLAIPLLLDCNKPTRRTTGVKIQELNKAKEFFLNPSNDRQESQEISVKRAGSVKHTVAKYKMLAQQEEKKDDYYEFLRRTSKKNNNKDETDGNNVEDEVADFTPKEVIDVEKALLDNEREERSRSALFKSSVWHRTGNTAELKAALEEFSDSQTPLNSIYMLQVLYNIHKRIHDDPSIDKYYRIYTKGHIFERYVWLLDGAEKFMIYAGWVRCGNYIVLSKSYPVNQTLNVVEEVLRKKKRAQIIYTGSLQQQKRPDVVIRRAHSNVGKGGVIDEDEILSSYTNIDVPNPEQPRNNETDSAFGSGFEEEEEASISKNRLRRLESKEHIVNSENYIVVDFVGNVSVSSRKSTKSEDDDYSPESALSISPTISMNSTFEEISSHDLPSDITNQPDKLKNGNQNEKRRKVIRVEESDLDQEDNSPISSSQPPVSLKEESKSYKEDEELKSSLSSEIKDAKNEILEEIPQTEVSITKPDIVAEERNHSGKKVYTASKGLKQVKKEKEEQQKLEEEKEKVVLSRKISDGSFKRNAVAYSSLPKSKNNDNLTRSSRSSSIKSLNSESGKASSIVLQNKLLFDNKIAGELKQKYSSTQSLNRSKSGSLNEKDPVRRTGSGAELDLTGKVAGAKGIFEAVSHGKRRPQTPSSDRKISQASNKENEGDKNENEVSLKESVDDKLPEIQEAVVKKPKKKKFLVRKKANKNTDSSITKTNVKEDHDVPESDVKLTNVTVVDNSEENLEHDEEKKKKTIFSRMKKRTKTYNIEGKQPSVSDDGKSENELLENENETNETAFTETVTNNKEDEPNIEKEKRSTLTEGLQDIIDRQPSFNEQDTKKKKKNIFKKKKQKSDKESNISATTNFNIADNEKHASTGEVNSNINAAGTSNDASFKFNVELNDHVDASITKLEGTNETEDLTPSLEGKVHSVSVAEGNNTKKSNVDMQDEQPDLKIETNELDVIPSDEESEIKSEISSKDNKLLKHDETNLYNDGDSANDSGESIDSDKINSDSEINVTPKGDLDISEKAEYNTDISTTSDVNNVEANNAQKIEYRTLPSISVEDTSTNKSVESTITNDINTNESDNNLIANGTDAASNVSDDELVNALNEVNKMNHNERLNSVNEDMIDGSGKGTLKKKKKLFPFHIKSSKKDKKTIPQSPSSQSISSEFEFNTEQGHQISPKSSKKSKKTKNLEISQNTQRSVSLTALDKIATENNKKKSKLNIFKKKKRTESQSKTSSFTTYADDLASPEPSTLEVSDEFKIPEHIMNGNGIQRSSSVVSEQGKNEYSKKNELIEIERPEAIEF